MSQTKQEARNIAVTALQVDGITCLDCAKKFEEAVGRLPDVQAATLNTITGRVTVQGRVDLDAIRRLGKEENYTITPLADDKVTELQVTGITCVDCARKFERAVGDMPSVTSVSLDALTGKLTVRGDVDLTAIRALGKEENYRIELSNPRTTSQTESSGVDWEKVRAVLSGIGLALAYGLEKTGASPVAFIFAYLATIVLGGWDNFKKAAYALPRLNFNMSVLMSIAVIGAVAIGEYQEGATVAFLYAVSEMLEAWTVARARRSIRQLMAIAPQTARVRRAEGEVEIPVEKVNVGDVMLVRPGEKIAMDGVIVLGESAVNQAAITGESIPVAKGPGDEVFAGTLNTAGYLEVRVTKLVQDTTLAKIIQMVENAQSQRAPTQEIGRAFAAVYTPIVLALAVLIVVIPPTLLGEAWIPWIYRGLALLVVACPCALVISTPVAIISAISNAARQGVLIKGGVYLEAAGSLKAMAFDKTGTLTQGEPVVTDILPAGTIDKDQLLQMAAALEARSEHPLAQAIVKAAQQNGLPALTVQEFKATAGSGVEGIVNGQLVRIGNKYLFAGQDLALAELAPAIERLQQEGKTVVAVGTEAALLGIIALADAVRPESAAAIKDLKAAGIQHIVMLTGDNRSTAQAVAAAVGVDEYRAELLPHDKLSAIQELAGRYGKVAMVGDGINDAPALAAATIGIAMGGAGTDTALETADVALMADDLSKLAFTVRLSRRALSIIRQNIAFSIGLKVLAVLAVFPGWLTLWLAILADLGATIIVTINSMRLLGVKAY